MSVENFRLLCQVHWRQFGSGWTRWSFRQGILYRSSERAVASSEVLAGERPLSLAMIRALHRGLRIPLESLVADSADDERVEEIPWDRFPVRELMNRGWMEAFVPPKSKRLVLVRGV